MRHVDGFAIVNINNPEWFMTITGGLMRAPYMFPDENSADNCIQKSAQMKGDWKVVAVRAIIGENEKPLEPER